MVSTLTRSDIADELYNTIGLSHNESSEIVELFFEEILQCFEKGEEVKLTSFGTFKIREKKERIGRNPKTGVEAKISSRKVVTFKPSSYIKEKITKYDKELKLLKQFKEEYFKNEGLEEEYKFVHPLEKDFKKLFSEFRKKKAEYREKIELDFAKNLKIKTQIIKDIESIISDEETIKETFEKFRALQEKLSEC